MQVMMVKTDRRTQLVDVTGLVERAVEKEGAASGVCYVYVPRKLPHAYLYVGEKPGRLLIAFTPAGKMEAYFRERRGLDPASFAKYDMEYVGPGLTLEEAAKV